MGAASLTGAAAETPATPAGAHGDSGGGTGVVLRGVPYVGSGYADGFRMTLAALADAGVPLQLVPLGVWEGRESLLPPQQMRAFARLERRRLNPRTSVFYECCAPPDFELQAEARARVGRTAFETDALPAGWDRLCQRVDEVWVPSEFNRETFLAGGVEASRLRVMGEGLDTRRYRPGLKPLPIPQRRGFNFLSVFEWGKRKGWDVLLRAWSMAFRADEDVALIIKSRKPGDRTGAELEKELMFTLQRRLGIALQRVAPILLLRGMLPEQDMPRLYASADAFVVPTRGEGWGRTYMEAAAAQLPVVATRWSGHLDFLNDQNSYLIDIEGLVGVPRDVDVDLLLGQRWAEPSAEHLAQILRHIFDHRDEARAKARQARHDMVTKWDQTVVAPRWVDEFQRLLG